MSTSLQERIEQLDDYKAVQLLGEYSNRLFEGLETELEEMLDGVPPELKDTELFQQAQSLSQEERDRPLSESRSAELARDLLRYFAQDPSLAPSLETTMNEYKDDRLIVGAILATGVAISMIIVAATTQAKGEIGGVKFKKTIANADLVGTIIKHFPKF